MEKCECNYYPTIIIPGIGQSKVLFCDTNGEAVKTAWPVDIDADKFIKKVFPSFLKMMIFRNDKAFCEKIKECIAEEVKPLTVNKEGVSTENLEVVDYNNASLEECSIEDKRYIYKMIPMKSLARKIGQDHLYFFAYNSFGQPYETAKRLDEYIQIVKEKTGHDKVNLLPVSLGGSIATAYFDDYAEKNDIHRVCYIIPATNGSSIITDMFARNIDFENPETFLSLLIDKKTSAKIMKYKDKLPENALENIISSVLDAVSEVFLKNCAGMWAVVPKEKYEEYRDKYLSGAEYEILRSKTDKYFKAQSNLREKLIAMEANGTKFFSICSYDLPLLDFVKTKDVNSDSIVDFNSASLGGSACKTENGIPTVFDDDYMPIYDRCKNTSHNHISPERTVDLGSAVFPDSTFCFRNLPHEKFDKNEKVLRLCLEILTNEEFTDVYSNSEFPQFTETAKNTDLINAV